MGFAAVYITCASKEQATALGEQLVIERLAACANVFPITSTYWWDDQVQRDDEWVAIVKTTLDGWEPLKARAEALHPYDVPCIMKIEVEANTAYEAWIEKETRSIT